MVPKISIITVVFNAAHEFKKTMQSIIDQDFKGYEWIVIDGGSTDGTAEIIKKSSSYISYWLSEADRGIYDAMNKGIMASRGDYITFLNAGDHYVNNQVLSIIISKLDGQDVLYGDIYYAPANNLIEAKFLKAKDFTWENLLAHGTAVVCHQAIFVKRSLAPAYNLKYKYKAELNWYFDIIEKNPNYTFMHLDFPVVYYYLGGLGYNHFLSNLYELCKLIIRRFGIRTFLRYQYPKIIWKKLKYRYPNLFVVFKRT